MAYLGNQKGAKFPVKAKMYRLAKELGAENVLGRSLTPKEANEMQIVNRLVSAYYARERATNEAAWANTDPGGFSLLMWAEGL